jgi:hypothetical protein
VAGATTIFYVTDPSTNALTPKAITAAVLGFTSRRLRRSWNSAGAGEYPDDEGRFQDLGCP